MPITSKLVVTFFKTLSGTPAIGLSPTVDIWEITPTSSTLVVNDDAMTEVGGGFYKYNFTSYNYELKYGFVIDGGTGLGVNRYVVGTNDSFQDDISQATWEEAIADHQGASPALDTFGKLLNAIADATLNPGSPQTGGGCGFTIQDIVSGVWNEILLASPAPYPADSAGGLVAQISDLQLTLDDAVLLIETLIKYEANRTVIDKTAFTLTVYDDDGITPIRTFSLRDSTGTPSITEIVERLPI